jgi:hypothetical protein
MIAREAKSEQTLQPTDSRVEKLYAVALQTQYLQVLQLSQSVWDLQEETNRSCHSFLFTAIKMVAGMADL